MTAEGNEYPPSVPALAEIDEEARRRRASGVLPSGYEDELERVFAGLSPERDDQKTVVRRSMEVVEQRSRFDARPPLASSLAGGTMAKRLIGKEIGWYVRFVVDQFEGFATAVVRALQVVEGELAAIGEALAEFRREVPDDVAPGVRGPRWWHEEACAALADAPGPILHADCGEGELLDALARRGRRAYGIDRSVRAADAAVRAGFRAHAAGLFEELGAVADSGLGALVLEGPVQWMAASDCERLCALAARRLAPRGVVVVASSTPDAWARTAPPVLVDLAPGRPLHPETWDRLLGAQGFAPSVVHRGGRDLRAELMEPISASLASAAPTARAVIDAVRDVLPGPEEYLLIAVRGD